MTTLLVVDDDRALRRLFRGGLEAGGYLVLEAESGETALDRFEATVCDGVLLDLHLPNLTGQEVLARMKAVHPEIPVLVVTGQSEVGPAVRVMQAGAADYLCKPVDLDELLLVVQRALQTAQLAARCRLLDRSAEVRTRPRITEFAGVSPAARRLRHLVARVAGSDAPNVLIVGESGTGKEVVARGLHAQGSRQGHSFVELNCAAISAALFESELFGHEKGAFTDATTTKRGLVELADRGTLFLDEIGEMSLPLQAKLLRFLQERRFRRVGGTQDQTVNVRVVAATNQDLARQVAAGRFRPDLYYRLNLITLALPPLRERPEDIGPLAATFLRDAAQAARKSLQGFTPEAAALLRAYGWPGNVRELRNVIERIVILEEDAWVRADHLPPEISGARPTSPAPALTPEGLIDRYFPHPLAVVERAYIEAVLERVQGNKTQAAERLGITRQTVLAWRNGTPQPPEDGNPRHERRGHVESSRRDPDHPRARS